MVDGRLSGVMYSHCKQYRAACSLMYSVYTMFAVACLMGMGNDCAWQHHALWPCIQTADGSSGGLNFDHQIVGSTPNRFDRATPCAFPFRWPQAP